MFIVAFLLFCRLSVAKQLDGQEVLVVENVGSQPFTMGMLYDSTTGRVMPGLHLWNESSMPSLTVEENVHSSTFSFLTQDDYHYIFNQLGLTLSVRIEIFFGLITLHAAGGFIASRRQSTSTRKLTLKYKVGTVFKHLSMDSLGKIEHRSLLDDPTATHVVAGIRYGAEAFFSFSERMKKTEYKAKGWGHWAVAAIAAVFEAVANAVDGGNLKEIKCDYRGDFSLKTTPYDINSAMEVYRTLPDLLGKNFENAKPKQIYLIPLSRLRQSTDSLQLKIEKALMDRIETMFERFRLIESRWHDLMDMTVVGYFAPLKNDLTMFREKFDDYQRRLRYICRPLIPAIRRGEKSESDLVEQLNRVGQTPFSTTEMYWWIKRKATEVQILQAYYDQLSPHASFVSSKAQMEGLIADVSFNSVTQLRLRIFPTSRDAYLEDMVEGLKWLDVNGAKQDVFDRLIMTIQHVIGRNKYSRPMIKLLEKLQIQWAKLEALANPGELLEKFIRQLEAAVGWTIPAPIVNQLRKFVKEVLQKNSSVPTSTPYDPDSNSFSHNKISLDNDSLAYGGPDEIKRYVEAIRTTLITKLKSSGAMQVFAKKFDTIKKKGLGILKKIERQAKAHSAEDLKMLLIRKVFEELEPLVHKLPKGKLVMKKIRSAAEFFGVPKLNDTDESRPAMLNDTRVTIFDLLAGGTIKVLGKDVAQPVVDKMNELKLEYIQLKQIEENYELQLLMEKFVESVLDHSSLRTAIIDQLWFFIPYQWHGKLIYRTRRPDLANDKDTTEQRKIKPNKGGNKKVKGAKELMDKAKDTAGNLAKGIGKKLFGGDKKKEDKPLKDKHGKGKPAKDKKDKIKPPKDKGKKPKREIQLDREIRDAENLVVDTDNVNNTEIEDILMSTNSSLDDIDIETAAEEHLTNITGSVTDLFSYIRKAIVDKTVNFTDEEDLAEWALVVKQTEPILTQILQEFKVPLKELYKRGFGVFQSTVVSLKEVVRTVSTVNKILFEARIPPDLDCFDGDQINRECPLGDGGMTDEEMIKDKLKRYEPRWIDYPNITESISKKARAFNELATNNLLDIHSAVKIAGKYLFVVASLTDDDPSRWDAIYAASLDGEEGMVMRLPPNPPVITSVTLVSPCSVLIYWTAGKDDNMNVRDMVVRFQANFKGTLRRVFDHLLKNLPGVVKGMARLGVERLMATVKTDRLDSMVEFITKQLDKFEKLETITLKTIETIKGKLVEKLPLWIQDAVTTDLKSFSYVGPMKSYISDLENFLRSKLPSTTKMIIIPELLEFFGSVAVSTFVGYQIAVDELNPVTEEYKEKWQVYDTTAAPNTDWMIKGQLKPLRTYKFKVRPLMESGPAGWSNVQEFDMNAADRKCYHCGHVKYLCPGEQLATGDYTVHMPGGWKNETVQVWCDMEFDNGDWTTVQRRTGKDKNGTFSGKTMNDYIQGFGSPAEEDFWVGLSYQQAVTFYGVNGIAQIGLAWFYYLSKQDAQMRMEMWDCQGQHISYTYRGFYLSCWYFFGHFGAEGGLNHANMIPSYTQFLAPADNSSDPKDLQVERLGSGFWMRKMSSDAVQANLNGETQAECHVETGKGIIWDSFHGQNSLLRSNIMIKPMGEWWKKYANVTLEGEPGGRNKLC